MNAPEFFASMLFAMAAVSYAESPMADFTMLPLSDTDIVFPAEYVEDFAIDGDVGKSVWRKATPIPGQMLRGGKEAVPYKDDVRLLWSRTALYFGATLWQDLSKASFKWDQRDMPTWHDDNLELVLFVPRANGKAGLYQFIVNPLGTVADLLDGDITWSNDGVEARTVRYADRWTLECRIPYAKFFSDRPSADDFVGARFCRWLHDGERRYVSASPFLIEAGNDQRRRFAKLLFKPPSGQGSEKVAAEEAAYRAGLRHTRFRRKFDAFRTRFEDIRAGSELFRRSNHPMHAKARGEVEKMAATLEAFETRWAAELADGLPPDDDAEAKFFKSANAFDRYAADNAYVVWVGDPWSSGSQTAMPAANAPAMPEKISFEQAGNEREQVCLEITGLLCGPRLDLRLWPEAIGAKGPLYSPKGQYLSSDSWEILREPFVQIEDEILTMPLIESAGNIVTVTPGRTVRVWVTLNSRGLSAGSYATSLKFKPLGNLGVPAREIPLEAKIWRFTLPETRDWPLKSFFWGPFSLNNDEVAQLSLAWECHITHGWTQFHRYQYGVCRENNVWSGPGQGATKASASHDFDDDIALHGNEAFLRRAKELGMRFVIGWSTPRSLDWFKAITGRFLGMGFGYEDFTFKGLLRDEFTKADIPIFAKQREAVWNWNTNLHFQATLLSTPPPTGATVQEMKDARLPDFYTQWTVIDTLIENPVRGPETIRMIRDAGKQVWSYQCSRFMHKANIRRYYRLYPWRCRLRGLDGVAMWTFCGWRGDGWDSRDGFDDGVTWRGLRRSCVPTKQLAAFREGLEDVAYMALLERASADAKRAGRESPEVKRLLSAREAIVKSADQKLIDDWRMAAGRELDRLEGAR